MYLSKFPLNTLKETPADAEIISHRLMLRAGLIRRLASGLYTWLPLGLRVLHKVENIIRSEMNASGAIEVLMPSIQPAEIWVESGRWEKISFLDDDESLDAVLDFPVAGTTETIFSRADEDQLSQVRLSDVLARAVFTRRGRRVANVRVFAYQDDPDEPVAVATAHFLLVQD